MPIEHIVISGGGPSGLMALGVIMEACEMGLLDIDNIKTISGTSVGAILGGILSIGHKLDVIYDYIVKRPWERALDSQMNNLVDIIEKGGMNGVEIIKIVFQPLLESADLSVDATLKDIYEKSGIELRVVTIDVNKHFGLEPCILSWKTFPDLPLYKAAAMSCAIPFIFRPIIYNSGCYIDGGLTSNYPLKLCTHDIVDRDTILGISNNYSEESPLITDNNNGLTFIKTLFKKMHNTMDSSSHEEKIKYNIVCNVADLSCISKWLEVSVNESIRRDAVDSGRCFLKKYLEGTVQELLESI